MPKPTLKDEHPAFLKKLLEMPDDQRTALGYTDEMLEDAEKGWLRESDYTKKTQEVAAVKKIMDANPGISLETAVETLKWAQSDWPRWKQRYDEMERAAKTPAPAAPAPSNGARRGKWVNEIAVEDFYETARLREKFAQLEEEWMPAARDAAAKYIREEWYDKEERPRLDKLAGGYTSTVINLLKAIWPSDKPSIESVLKEAAVRGTPDLVAVYNDLVTKGTETREGGFNEGYKKAREESEVEFRKKYNIPESTTPPPAATPPSATGPLGGTQPTWKKPETVAPKGAADRFAAVMQKVEAKHGPLPR